MSATAYDQPGQTQAPAPLGPDPVAEARKRVRVARQDRKRFESLWEECLAFAAGKMWLERSKVDKRRLYLPELRRGQVRYTVDEISKYRETLLGELSMDDDLPQMLFRQEDQQNEDFADQANDLIAYGWEAEWQADEAVEDAKITLVDLGTSAIRVRFDPSAGQVKQRVPIDAYGKTAIDDQTVESLKTDGRMPDGSLPRFKAIHEGCTRWESGTPFNLLVPPGVKRERNFPWEGWMAAVPLGSARELWPDANLKADSLSDVETLGQREIGTFDDGSTPTDTSPARLEDHVLVFWYYERPSATRPKGCVYVFAGEKMQLVEERDQLPYQTCDGGWHSGIFYFHYLRLTNRFWSRGVVERGMSAQRAINEGRSMVREHIRRGGPKVYMARGAVEKQPTGATLEVVYVDPTKPKPIVDGGVPVGAWMFQDLEASRDDLARSVGVNDVSLGENPNGVGNYSQLALLREQDMRGLDPVVTRIKKSLAGATEVSLYDIQKYWPESKQIAIAGPDGELRAHTFKKSTLPTLIRVTFPKGAARPRSQAAQLKMVDDIATYSINSGQPLPTDWLKESYESGRPMDLPDADKNDQQEKARYENGMLADMDDPGVDYFDDHALHVTEHRSLQIQAKLAGRMDVYGLAEQHVQAHLAAAAQAQATAQQGPLPVPGLSGQPPQQPGMPVPVPTAMSLFRGSQTPLAFGG